MPSSVAQASAAGEAAAEQGLWAEGGAVKAALSLRWAAWASCGLAAACVAAAGAACLALRRRRVAIEAQSELLACESGAAKASGQE